MGRYFVDLVASRSEFEDGALMLSPILASLLITRGSETYVQLAYVRDVLPCCSSQNQTAQVRYRTSHYPTLTQATSNRLCIRLKLLVAKHLVGMPSKLAEV